jgi:fido (protein-threonine AMPylation protein)
MGEIYSDFLDELLSNIRARPISWDAQQRSGVIDESEVRTVKTIDKQRRDKRIDIVTKVSSSEEWLMLIAGREKVCSAHVEFG